MNFYFNKVRAGIHERLSKDLGLDCFSIFAKQNRKKLLLSPVFQNIFSQGVIQLHIITPVCRAITVIMLVMGFSSSAMAQAPTELLINGVGAQGTFSITSPSGCAPTDTITVSSANSSIATVSPASLPSTGTPQTFTVTRVFAGTTTINGSYTCLGSVGNFAVHITDDPTDRDGHEGGDDGDPISTHTGELFKQYAPDMNLGGVMPLFFSRYYASSLKAANITSVLGDNWRHNFDWSMNVTANLITIVTPQGRTITFGNTSPGQTATWKLLVRKDIIYQLTADVILVPAANGTSISVFVNVLVDPTTNKSYYFSQTGQLLRIDNGVGNNSHLLKYNASNQLIQVTEDTFGFVGRTLNFSYNAVGKLISVDDGAGRSVGFAYTANDLTAVTDILGNTTNYSYAAGGLMTATTRPMGNTTFSQLWNNNKVVSQTDGLNNTTTLAYAGNTTTITDPLSRAMVHIHSSTGKLGSVNRRDGTSVALSYNAEGQRSTIADSLGASTSITYDNVDNSGFFPKPASGRVAQITHANGATTSNSYLSTRTRGRIRGSNPLIKLFDLNVITHADGSKDTFVHDSFNGGLTSHTDRSGNVTNYVRNADGQWASRENPLTGRRERTYNADGTVAVEKLRFDPLGFRAFNTTTFAYDSFRRLISTTFADGSTNLFTYDLMNRPLTITDNRGGVTTMVYDANGNLTSSTDRTGIVSTFTYDAMDKVTKVTDANGAFSTRSYDALRHLASSTDRNGNIVSFGYDTQNRLNAVTDGNGNISHRSFDSEGILATTTTPLGNVTTFTSDNMGRITQVSSPLGNNVQMAYDTMGRITSTTDPLGNMSSATYDALGLIASRTLPGAISASYTRNALGQITQITDPLGNNWLRSFDKVGRATGSIDPLNRPQTFTYDNRNRVNAVTFPGALGTRTNTYDANGNLTRKLYSDGTDLAFTFDAEDRLLTANGLALTRDNLGRITNSNGITMAYDAGGRITSTTYAAGKAVTYTYDANNNVKTVTDWVGGVSTFTYDADNRLISMPRPNGVTATYTYDIDGRLTGFTDGTLGSTTLTRNAKGQITSAARTVPTAASAATMTATAHTFDAAAQVSTAGFTYDALGRQTSNGATAFTWDLASRLSSAGAATYTYDGIGYRLIRTTAAGTRNYVWNLALSLPSVSIEKQGIADLRYYVHTPGGALLYSIDAAGNARHFYHFDETGNTRFVSSDAGAVEASYAYSPFGVVQATTGVLDNPFTWQGQFGIFDDGNGLYYVRARYYTANSGRFISKDSVKSIAPKQVNPYQYALNDPLQFSDFSGRKFVFVARAKRFAAQGKFFVAEAKRLEAKAERFAEQAVVAASSGGCVAARNLLKKAQSAVADVADAASTAARIDAAAHAVVDAAAIAFNATFSAATAFNATFSAASDAVDDAKNAERDASDAAIDASDAARDAKDTVSDATTKVNKLCMEKTRRKGK